MALSLGLLLWSKACPVADASWCFWASSGCLAVRASDSQAVVRADGSRSAPCQSASKGSPLRLEASGASADLVLQSRLHHTLLERQQLFVVAGPAAHRSAEAASAWVFDLKRSWCPSRHCQSQCKRVVSWKHIADRSHACAVLEHRFATAIQNSGIHIRIHNGVAAGVVDVSAQHVAASSFRAGDVAALPVAVAWLGARVGSVAGSEAHGGEPQVCCPCRLRDQQEGCKQQ